MPPQCLVGILLQKEIIPYLMMYLLFMHNTYLQNNTKKFLSYLFLQHFVGKMDDGLFDDV